jgi:hypothetical protein
MRLASLPPFGLGLVHLAQVVRHVRGRHKNAIILNHVLDSVALSGIYFSNGFLDLRKKPLHVARALTFCNLSELSAVCALFLFFFLKKVKVLVF